MDGVYFRRKLCYRRCVMWNFIIVILLGILVALLMFFRPPNSLRHSKKISPAVKISHHVAKEEQIKAIKQEAKTLVKQQKFEEAYATLKKLCKIEGHRDENINTDALNKLLTYVSRYGNVSESIQKCSNFVKKHMEYADSHTYKLWADLHAENGEFSKAVQILESATDVKDSNIDTQASYVEYCLSTVVWGDKLTSSERNNFLNKAHAIILNMNKKDTTEEDLQRLYVTLANYDIVSGNLKDAYSSLLKSMDILGGDIKDIEEFNSNRVYATFLLTEIAINNGDIGKAREFCKKHFEEYDRLSKHNFERRVPYRLSLLLMKEMYLKGEKISSEDLKPILRDLEAFKKYGYTPDPFFDKVNDGFYKFVLYREKGDTDRAILSLKELIDVLANGKRRCPVYRPLIRRRLLTMCYTYLGDMYKKKGEIAKAHWAYTQAEKIMRNDTVAKNRLKILNNG